MKKIALSREQMEKLGCLGIDVSNATMRYERFGSNNIVDSKIVFTWDNWKLRLGYNDSKNCNNYQVEPALTLQDIMEMLPLDAQLYHPEDHLWQCIFNESGEIEELGGYVLRESESPIDASFELLCWCAENGYLNQ